MLGFPFRSWLQKGPSWYDPVRCCHISAGRGHHRGVGVSGGGAFGLHAWIDSWDIEQLFSKRQRLWRASIEPVVCQVISCASPHIKVLNSKRFHYFEISLHFSVCQSAVLHNLTARLLPLIGRSKNMFASSHPWKKMHSFHLAAKRANEGTPEPPTPGCMESAPPPFNLFFLCFSDLVTCSVDQYNASGGRAHACPNTLENYKCGNVVCRW